MAKDIYHQVVKQALEKEGWKITHDPLRLFDKDVKIDYEIDLAAEKLLFAEKTNEKIAVEVKNFLRTSMIHEFHGVLGQYLVYQAALLQIEADRKLFLAISSSASEKLEDFLFLQQLIEQYRIKIIVFDESSMEIITWKK